MFRDEVEPQVAARRISTKYGVADYSVHPWFGLYATGIGELAAAQLRCEPDVAWVKRFTYPSPGGDVMCSPCTSD